MQNNQKMLPSEPMRPVPQRAHDNNGKPFGRYPVWVGNISDSMTDEELEGLFHEFDFVSVSVTQIHKCAFVNFDDWNECQRSIATMNGLEYAGKKLAVRLRNERPQQRHQNNQEKKIRSNPNSLGAGSPRREQEKGATEQDRAAANGGAVRATGGEKGKSPMRPLVPRAEKAKVRYFIMKSQSAHDLEISIEKGVWVTRPHNESVLNMAFETSENVYLFFGITKSGEFFGLARMASPSGNCETFDWTATESSSSSKESSPPVETDSTPHKDTTATTTPTSSEEKESQAASFSSSPGRSPYSSPPPASKVGQVFRDSLAGDFGLTNQLSAGSRGAESWGKPFAIQWLSLKKVPFQFTSHLINPWNEGNPVKISRDGTEIEPAVGNALQSLFLEDGQASLGDAATGSATSPISSPLVTRVPYPNSQRFPIQYSQIPGYQVTQPYYQGYMIPPQAYPYQNNRQGYSPYPYQGRAQSYQPGYYHNGLYVPLYYPIPSQQVQPVGVAMANGGGPWPAYQQGEEVEALSENVGNMSV